jgi:hypothetical protein
MKTSPLPDDLRAESGCASMETSSTSKTGKNPPATNWRRVLRVWALLALAMAATTLIGWAALPRAGSPTVSGRAPAADRAAIEAIAWPKEMTPGRTWRFIVIHHSATPSGTMESIDQGHRDRGFSNGAGYHFLINNGRAEGTADGQVTPTSRWLEQLDGAHTKVREHPELNTEGIGICLIGNFDQEPPTPAQMASLEMLVLALRDRYDIPLERILGHGELKNTRCPGRLFPLEAFLMEVRQSYLKTRLQGPPGEAP